MRPSLSATLIVACLAGACGRIGYSPLAASGGSGATGGGGTAGGGTGGDTGGTGGSIGGAAGTGAGAAGGTGTAGSDGGAPISCNTLTYGTHQYAFCDALVDWATARAECEGRGMRLVRFDDAAENNWVAMNAVFSASMYKRDALWLGGYEPSVDGDWHWTDGDAFWLGAANGMAVGGLYTNWNKSEPNNATGPEACLSMNLNGTTWYDWACSAVHYFACEMY